MKKKWIKRLCLHVGLAFMSATPSLTGQTLDFVRFQAENIANTDYGYIDIDALVIDTGSGVRVGVFNNTSPTAPASATRPTVASIYFDASSAFLSASPTFNAGLSSSGVGFVSGGAPPDLPGGAEIGFSADTNFTATPPPAAEERAEPR